MTWIALALAATIAQAAAAAPPTRQEMAAFLQKASVVHTRSTRKGITSPLRITPTT